MTREEMMQEVDRRTSDLLMDHLFARSTELHAKQEWRDCDCTFCKEKRNATHYVGLAAYPPRYDGERPRRGAGWFIDPETFEISEPDVNLIDVKRDAIRKWYRQRLSDLKTAGVTCESEFSIDNLI